MTAKLSIEIRHPAPPPGAFECWVLLPGPDAGPLAKRRYKAPAGPMAQDLVWLRDRLMFAYLAPGDYRETERPSDADGCGVIETGRTRDAFPRARAADLAECPLDGADESTKLPFDYVATLARDTTRVTCSETRKKKKSAIPLGPTAFEDAYLVRTVATLAPELSRWIRYTYADSIDWNDEAGNVLAAWESALPQLGKMQGKTLQRAKGLAHLAVQHHKHLKNSGKSRYDGPALALLLGVSDVNYRQHWRARWDALQSALDQIDTRALETLWRAL
jgi:hypothetical protein